MSHWMFSSLSPLLSSSYHQDSPLANTSTVPLLSSVLSPCYHQYCPLAITRTLPLLSSAFSPCYHHYSPLLFTRAVHLLSPIFSLCFHLYSPCRWVLRTRNSNPFCLESKAIKVSVFYEARSRSQCTPRVLRL